jgi:putative ABC transport system ATP-binding protein
VLSADGKVAEQGPYSVLSKNPDGAFTKLMEWQLHGGATSLPGSSTQSDHASDDPEDTALEEEATRQAEEELNGGVMEELRDTAMGVDPKLGESDPGGR